jgi:hypothetical protein
MRIMQRIYWISNSENTVLKNILARGSGHRAQGMGHGAWGMELIGEFHLFSNRQGDTGRWGQGEKRLRHRDLERRAWGLELIGEFHLFSNRQGDKERWGQGEKRLRLRDLET